MKQVIAMHGWSCDSTVWASWERHFSHRGWLWQNGERGYGNRRCCHPSWAEPTSGATSPCMASQRRVVIVVVDDRRCFVVVARPPHAHEAADDTLLGPRPRADQRCAPRRRVPRAPPQRPTWRGASWRRNPKFESAWETQPWVKACSMASIQLWMQRMCTSWMRSA